MPDTRTHPNSLPIPPVAAADPHSVEILRVWAAPGQSQQFILKPVWKDAAAWGLLLVDIARQAANAYASDSQSRDAILARIKAGFDAEWGSAG
jgi:hypothetical protein